MNRKRLNPRPILETAHGVWRAGTLCAACELGVFSALAGRASTAAGLAARLNAPERSLSMLLNANAALGFLVKRGLRYSNSPVAEAYLVKGRKGYLGDAVVHMSGALAGRWARLAEVVKGGLPVHRLPRSPQKEETARHFTLAMHGMSAFTGHLLASRLAATRARLDLGRYHKLLDIGGGSGVISTELAERFPRLQAVVLDRPEVCRVARELWRSSSAAGRLSACARSYLQPLPRGCDVALLSQILHAEDEGMCRRLLKRVYDVLDAPGLVIVIEFALNEERTAPRFPALFSLNMLINTDEGAAYSRREFLGWLRDAGFKRPRAEPLPGDRTLFIAQKSAPLPKGEADSLASEGVRG